MQRQEQGMSRQIGMVGEGEVFMNRIYENHTAMRI